MRVMNVDKDLVFYYLKDNEDVYAFNTDNTLGYNLKHETVCETNKLLSDDKCVFFTVKEDD